MKHITKQLGKKTNLLECTGAEYEVLKGFFSQMGIMLEIKNALGERVQLQAHFDCHLQVVEEEDIDYKNSLGSINFDDEAYLDICSTNGKLYGCFGKM